MRTMKYPCSLIMTFAMRSEIFSEFLFNPFKSIKGTMANSVDPDQTLHNAASDLDRHCLHLIQFFIYKIW